MADAMRQVRDALGEDAIIVASREDTSGVHITAAVEPQPEISASPFEINEKRAIPKMVMTEEEILEELTELFLKHRTPSSVTDKIVTAAASFGAENTHRALTNALSSIFRFEPLPARKAGKPIALVGPPGAGKTLTAAKLAARAIMNDIPATVISTDTVRAGGTEQLQAFLRVMQLKLSIAEQADDVKAILSRTPKEGHQVIIDTGGLNPFDPHEMKELARILSSHDMDAVLVLPAGTDAEESAEIALTFGILGVRKLLPTRLDFARRMGGLFAACERAGMSFTDASNTPDVAHGLVHLSADTLASLLLPQSDKPVSNTVSR